MTGEWLLCLTILALFVIGIAALAERVRPDPDLDR